MVHVRLFAALREAAGTDTDVVEPGPLPRVLTTLADRYGEPFATRVRLASVLINGHAVRRDAGVEVPDGAELALLPPVSGGR